MSGREKEPEGKAYLSCSPSSMFISPMLSKAAQARTSPFPCPHHPPPTVGHVGLLAALTCPEPAGASPIAVFFFSHSCLFFPHFPIPFPSFQWSVLWSVPSWTLQIWLTSPHITPLLACLYSISPFTPGPWLCAAAQSTVSLSGLPRCGSWSPLLPLFGTLVSSMLSGLARANPFWHSICRDRQLLCFYVTFTQVRGARLREQVKGASSEGAV